MTSPRWLLVALLLAGCDGSSSAAPAPAPSAPAPTPAPAPPPAPRFDRDLMRRLHMHANFDLLRAIEKLLIRGHLADAKAVARAMAEAPDEPGLARWAADAARVRSLARSLAEATNVDEACRREARLAVACAGCHVATGVVPDFSAPPALPPDQPTIEARMARHLWATDRLWEAAVGGGDEPWTKGLDVLAQAPFPFRSSADDRARLARRLQQLADQARKRTTNDTLAERGHAYGEMLVVCATCHTTGSATSLPSKP